MINNPLIAVTETRIASCQEHGEYESVLLNLGVGKWTGCPECSKQAIANHEAQRQVEQPQDLRRMKAQAIIESAGVPRRLQSASLRSYTSCGGEQQQAHRLVCEYAKDLPAKLDSGDGLILMGNMGTGKTHLAVGLINASAKVHGVASRYITAPALFTRVRASYSGNGETEASILAEYAKTPLLVLDEIGVGKGSDSELNLLYAILGSRYDECRPTILVTNLMSEDLKAWLGDRVVDRLKETSPVVLFTWESYRGRV